MSSENNGEPVVDLDPVTALRAEVAELRGMVDDMSRVLEQFVVQRQMETVMPQVEAHLRTAMHQKLAADGFKSVIQPPVPAVADTPPV